MSVFLYFPLFVLSGRAMLVVDAFAHQSFFCKAEFCSKLGLELKPIFLMTLYLTQLFQSLGAETQLQIYSALATGKLIKSLLQQYDKIFRYYLLDQSRFTHRGCCNCCSRIFHRIKTYLWPGLEVLTPHFSCSHSCRIRVHHIISLSSPGLGVLTLCHSFMPVSGAHLNPAVSIACVVTKKISMLRWTSAIKLFFDLKQWM